jgi:hypothetical protein
VSPFGPPGANAPSAGFPDPSYVVSPNTAWSAYESAGPPPASLAVAPKQVGSKMVFAIVTQSSSATTITSLACPAVGGAWTRDFFLAASNGNNGRMEFWSGVVTEPGPSTLTPTYGGGDNTHNVAIFAVEVQSPFGADVAWTTGSSGDVVPGTSGNLSFPALETPNQYPGGVYVGIAASFGTLAAPLTPAGWSLTEAGGAGVSGRFLVTSGAAVLGGDTTYTPTLANSGGDPYAAAVIYSAAAA